uniref:Uncharacterized protein n=1 Tax=Klebsiella pneumoniae TaxID=573 RepID=A0A2P1BPE3_KLEPN|nr:hypothetical protein [Klebsiella pneumoniae]
MRLYYNAVDRRAQASNEWHAEWISKRGLKARLWTDKAISEFLGAPLSAGPVKARKQKEVKSRSDTRFQNMAGTTSRMAGCAG